MRNIRALPLPAPHQPDEELRQAARALAIAAYEFAAAARKGSAPIPREDIRAVMSITDEWADLTARLGSGK